MSTRLGSRRKELSWRLGKVRTSRVRQKKKVNEQKNNVLEAFISLTKGGDRAGQEFEPAVYWPKRDKVLARKLNITTLLKKNSSLCLTGSAPGIETPEGELRPTGGDGPAGNRNINERDRKRGKSGKRRGKWGVEGLNGNKGDGGDKAAGWGAI